MKRIEKVKEFYENFAENYDINRFHTKKQKISDYISKLILKDLLGDIHNKRILECGCGTGRFLEFLEKQYESDGIYGIDVSENMLKISKNKIKNVTLKKGSVLDIPFKSDFFDYVFSFQVLTHIHTFDKPLNEMRRVTSSGGFITIDFRNLLNFKNFLYNIKQHLFGDKKGYFPKFNTIFYIKKIAKKNNLRVVDIRGIRRVNLEIEHSQNEEIKASKSFFKYFYPVIIIHMKKV